MTPPDTTTDTAAAVDLLDRMADHYAAVSTEARASFDTRVAAAERTAALRWLLAAAAAPDPAYWWDPFRVDVLEALAAELTTTKCHPNVLARPTLFRQAEQRIAAIQWALQAAADNLNADTELDLAAALAATA